MTAFRRSKIYKMQYKIYSIPIVGGETELEELNHFLRSHKVVDVMKQLVTSDRMTCWSFCITYLPTSQPLADNSEQRKPKVDYRLLLDEASFSRFTIMRKVRKSMAESLAVPPYAIFTDAEMAEVAKLAVVTPSSLKGIPGIGANKVEKFSEDFINRYTTEIQLIDNEKSGTSV